jgi:hypothetical protein
MLYNDGDAKMDPVTMFALFGLLMAAAVTAGCCGYEGPSNDPINGGKVIDEQHYDGPDEKTDTADDLYQVHVSEDQTGREKAYDFHGDRWNCSDTDRGIDVGDHLIIQGKLTSEGRYDVKKIIDVQKP